MIGTSRCGNAVRHQRLLNKACATQDHTRRSDLIRGRAIVQGLDPGATAEVQGFFLGTGTGELEVFTPAANGTVGAGAPSAEQAGDATVSTQ